MVAASVVSGGDGAIVVFERESNFFGGMGDNRLTGKKMKLGIKAFWQRNFFSLLKIAIREETISLPKKYFWQGIAFSLPIYPFSQNLFFSLLKVAFRE